MTSVAEPGQDCRTDSGRVAAFLREADHDRYLATLFAPAERRDALIALYAFNAEIARVREIVSDALPGEMRYQWWREVLHGDGRGDVSAHPVAAALLDVVRLHRLPLQSLENLIDARTFDLYDDPMPSLTEFEGYCGETSSALIRLASLVLADGQDPGGAEAAGHAGVAYAVAGLLRALPWHASRGQVYVPQDVLERHGVSPRQIVEGQDSPGLRSALSEMRALARRHLGATRDLISSVSPAIAPAFLPVALVEPYLARMERADYHPFRTRVTLPDWRKIWILWRAARRAMPG